jgi:hypothetical protein
LYWGPKLDIVGWFPDSAIWNWILPVQGMSA